MSKISEAARLIGHNGRKGGTVRSERKLRREAATLMGRKGGSVRSEAKTAAARRRAALGMNTGRPRVLYPACTKDPPYHNRQHRFSKKTNRCYGCGYQR